MSLQTRNQRAKKNEMEPDVEPKDKKEMTTDEKLDKLLKNTEDVLSLKSEITVLTNSVKTLTADISELKRNTDSIPKLENTLKNLQATITTVTVESAANTIGFKENQNRISTLEEENVTLKTELENLKCQVRRNSNLDKTELEEMVKLHITRQQDKNSLVFEGVAESKSENLKSLIRQISYDAGHSISENDITEIYRLGKYNRQDKRPRSIKATFLNRTTRNQIYISRFNIKQNPACDSVWINECLDEDQKRIRAEVRAVVDLATSQGKEARAVADTAIISGIKYQHSTFATLPPDLSLEKAYTREIDDKIYFSSEHSPLSSFYPLEIIYDNHTYKHNEQGFQHQKAVVMGKIEIADQIKKEPSPRKCKTLGKLLGHSKIWDDKRESIMGDLVNIKAQHPDIREKLMKTGDKELIESTADNFWACGGSLRSRKVRDGTATGKNKLGLIWSKTRRDLQAAQNPKDNDRNEMPALEDN